MRRLCLHIWQMRAFVVLVLRVVINYKGRWCEHTPPSSLKIRQTVQIIIDLFSRYTAIFYYTKHRFTLTKFHTFSSIYFHTSQIRESFTCFITLRNKKTTMLGWYQILIPNFVKVCQLKRMANTNNNANSLSRPVGDNMKVNYSCAGDEGIRRAIYSAPLNRATRWGEWTAWRVSRSPLQQQPPVPSEQGVGVAHSHYECSGKDKSLAPARTLPMSRVKC